MSRLPGHETCYTCRTCGLGSCPDCDSAGKTCPIIHEGEPMTIVMTQDESDDYTHGRLHTIFTPETYVARRRALIQTEQLMQLDDEVREYKDLDDDEKRVLAAVVIGIPVSKITSHWREVSEAAGVWRA